MSLDESKGLELTDGGNATLTDYSEVGDKITEEHGEWKYDAVSKKYLVTLKGETVAYSLVSPDHIVTCMLIKGDAATADLTASWFWTQLGFTGHAVSRTKSPPCL
jgi:hypothetical protein